MDYPENNSKTKLLVEKWAPILGHQKFNKIDTEYKKYVTAVLLENQHNDNAQNGLLSEGPANFIGNNPSAASNNRVNTWDPILMSLVRRSMPNLIAYDICGVQPMTGPTGLIFALKSRYASQSGQEAMFQEADTAFGGSGGTGSQTGSASLSTDPFGNGTVSTSAAGIGAPTPGYDTQSGENLGDSATNQMGQMAVTIEKSTVEAKTRVLKAEYTLELAQDLRSVHGLDADTELSNMLANEILAEINREVVRTIYRVSKLGCASGQTQTTGIFDVNVDSNGRWSVEKFKGLIYQIEREANQIAKETRRGKGNYVICSSNVASALAMAGTLDYTPALSVNLNVDDTGNTFAGILNGKYRVYIDPYFSASATTDFICVGYKGTHPYDAGLFYCPYVPLQMVRAVGENSFQPKIAFRTRYGLVSNPFVQNSDGSADAMRLTQRLNQYFRIFRVDNLF